MLTLENEYFIRLLLLILKGGTSVLKQVFMKKIEDSGLHLAGFLHANIKKIDNLKEDKVLTLKQYSILFPSNGKVTDAENYDISLITCLLLNIWALEKSEVKAIENIRTLRNDFQAHHPNASIDGRTFFRKWNQLRTSIDNLRNVLTREQSSNLEEVIRSVGEDPVDIKQAIEDIKNAASSTDQLMEHVSQQLQNIALLVQQLNRNQEDTRTEVMELRKKVENRNVSSVIIGKVTVSSEIPEAAVSAARILMEDARKQRELSEENENNKETEQGDVQKKHAGTKTEDLHSRGVTSFITYMKNRFFGSSQEKAYRNVIELIQKGENEYTFVAFFINEIKNQDDSEITQLLDDQLNKTLQNLTGIERNLICIPELSFMFLNLENYVLYLDRSLAVIVNLSRKLSAIENFALKMAIDMRMKIVPIVLLNADYMYSQFEKELLEKSDVRLDGKKEKNGIYTWAYTFENFGDSLLRLVAKECRNPENDLPYR